MIKGVLFDIDDTLYSHKLKAIPRKSILLLKKLREKGIKTGICTSRLMIEMDSVPRELLDLIDLKIMGTGSSAFIENRYYKAYSLNKDDVKKYMDYFKKKNISYSYSDINSDVYYWGDKSLIDEGRVLSWAKREIMIKEYEDEDITNIFYYHVNPEDIDFILNVNKDAYISKWGNSGNICGSYVDKSFGVLKFCEVFGFTTDEVAACGDGSNDKEMLEMAGIGIAVANAKENTKKAADYVCKKPIEDGGLYEAFIDLQIIEESKLDKLLNIIK